MKIKRIIKKGSRKLDKAANDTDKAKALEAITEVLVDVLNALAAETSGCSISRGIQIALSAAFEVMAKDTEKVKGLEFKDFELKFKKMLVEGVEEAKEGE